MGAVTPAQLLGAALSHAALARMRHQGERDIGSDESPSTSVGETAAAVRIMPGSRVDEVMTSFSTLGNMLAVSQWTHDPWRREPTPQG